MGHTGSLVYSDDAAIPYPSIASLKEAHARLLKRHHSGETNEMLAEIEAFIKQGRATGALLDSDDDRWAGQSLLDYWATVLYRTDKATLNSHIDTTLAEFDASLAPRLDDSLCPYIGLNAFQEDDREKFFGRDRLVKVIVNRLENKRLLAVVGPSGSGKSSLVLAGLLPMLRNGVIPGSENWQYFPSMVPGSNPLNNLALLLKPNNKNSAEWKQQQVAGFKQDQNHLLRLLNEFSDEPALIVVDQFEEVFTLCNDESLRQPFIDNLINLVQSHGTKHIVILTMRTEYTTQVAQLETLQPLFERGQVHVTPLSVNELQDAIEKPAASIGLKFEDGIIDKLVRDILGEPAGLPLLQFTLHRLWKSREGKRNRITWKAYNDLGGARRALALTADEFYQRLIHEQKETAKYILLRLVRPSEGAEVTSNRVRRMILYKSGIPSDRVDAVLKKLVNTGLVRLTRGDTKGEDQIEVAHEALVRNWPTLVCWLDEERIRLRQRLRLTAAAEQWLAHDRDEGGLLGGSLLQEALGQTDLNELETEFVQASKEATESAEQKKEAARLHELELERAKALAERERAEDAAAAARKFRQLSIALAIVTLLAIAAMSLAIAQGRRALESEERAKANEEAAVKSAKEADKARQRAEKEYNNAQLLREFAEREREFAVKRLAELNKLSKGVGAEKSAK